jgi:hypothetical protein
MNINICNWTLTSDIPFQSASGSLFREYEGKEVKFSMSMLLGHVEEAEYKSIFNLGTRWR